MDVVEVGALEIAFERHGAGPPLVLLHGFVGHSREWRRQIDDLSDEWPSRIVSCHSPCTSRGERSRQWLAPVQAAELEPGVIAFP